MNYRFLASAAFLFFVLHSFAQADSARLKKHVNKLVYSYGNRDYQNINVLDSCANYIANEMRLYADTVYDQLYQADGKTYRNVIASFGKAGDPVLVIGAHYDVCGYQHGADDNASGVAGLLELARMLDSVKLKYRIELVAFTLEEPPFFRTENMGSFIHAQSLKKKNENVIGMISLEMIGYFSDEKGSQQYPVSALKLIYGSRGNFITLVSKMRAKKFGRKFSRKFKGSGKIRTKKFKAPAVLPGIDFSDHLNYWHFGYSALMVTDTAFFRNTCYHTPQDTVDRLDFKRMGNVVDAVFAACTGM